MSQDENRPARQPRLPGPDHPISIAPNPKRVTVRLGGRLLADSRRSLTLKEASYPPVQYIPRDDVDMALLSPSRRATYCPYKGECSYFSIAFGETLLADAVWCYETPYPAVAAIAGHLAFYPDRAETSEET